MGKTTKTDFELFKKECEYWINWFGLNSWSVTYEHKNLNGSSMQVDYDTMNRDAVLKLDTKLTPDKHSDDYIRISAFHEVAELLICRLTNVAQWIGSKDFVLDRQHEIIHILEKSVYKKNSSGIK